MQSAYGGVGDRVEPETAPPPVFGKENGRQAVNVLASTSPHADAGFSFL